jgi:hypothetical protein
MVVPGIVPGIVPRGGVTPEGVVPGIVVPGIVVPGIVPGIVGGVPVLVPGIICEVPGGIPVPVPVPCGDVRCVEGVVSLPGIGVVILEVPSEDGAVLVVPGVVLLRPGLPTFWEFTL